MTTARKLLVTFLLWVPALVMIAFWSVFGSRLPAELPTHWGVSGPADGVSSTSTFTWIMFAIAVAASIIGTVFVWRAPRNRWVSRGMVAATAATAAFIAAMWLTSAALSIDVSDPYSVVLGGGVLPAMLSPLYGLIPMTLVHKGYTRPVAPADEVAIAPVTLAPGQTAATSSFIVSPMFVWITIFVAALMLPAIVLPLLFEEHLPAGYSISMTLLAIVSILLAAVLCAYRVQADWRGLRVKSWLFGIPLKRIPLANIESASAATLEPMEWGGWGYRWMPGRSAIIRKRGPGLVVDRVGGRQFAVSVNNPAEEASVLMGLKNQSTGAIA